MIDISTVDDEIRYLDFEPRKKYRGGHRWLVALLLAPGILVLVVLLVGAVLEAKW